MHLTDAELVRLVVMGNQDALGILFDRHYRLVMSVALRILHDLGEAEDVVQTVFTEFYEKAKLFDETKGNLRTWLLQYAYGRSFNQKQKLRRSCLSEPVGLERIDLERHKEPPERVLNLETPDAKRLVEEILPRLNERQRTVIQMAFFEGMRFAEVAKRTGESVGNVHHAYYRGMDKLRSLLDEPNKPVVNEERAREREISWLPRPRKTPHSVAREADIA